MQLIDSRSFPPFSQVIYGFWFDSEPPGVHAFEQFESVYGFQSINPNVFYISYAQPFRLPHHNAVGEIWVIKGNQFQWGRINDANEKAKLLAAYKNSL